ncbi:DUF4913 domain-containing protein [Cryobacterium roopkundense]|uniref:DUF4913 domain-containing protein n=1 Tax=Cryobacterium roopkundense TaxID=1001240 RepID=UPI00136295D1
MRGGDESHHPAGRDLSSWWTNHWDRHAAILFDPQAGPFRFCDRTRGHLADTKETGPAVPVNIPPATWKLSN